MNKNRFFFVGAIKDFQQQQQIFLTEYSDDTTITFKYRFQPKQNETIHIVFEENHITFAI